MTMSETFSAERRGKSVAAVGSPFWSQRFSRRDLSSLNRLPARATSVRLITTGPPVSGFFAEADAVADQEAAGIGESDLLVVPVGIIGQCDRFGRDLRHDRLGSMTQ